MQQGRVHVWVGSGQTGSSQEARGGMDTTHQACMRSKGQTVPANRAHTASKDEPFRRMKAGPHLAGAAQDGAAHNRRLQQRCRLVLVDVL